MRMDGGQPIGDEIPQTVANMRIVMPAPPLRRFLSAYFISDFAGEPVTDLSVPEWGGLRVILKGALDVRLGANETFRATDAYVQGPSSRAFEFGIGHCRIFGAGLTPSGFARFWNTDLRTLANSWRASGDFADGTLQPLVRDLHNASDDETLFAVADGFFTALLQARPSFAATAQVSAMHELLNKPEIGRVEELAVQSGMSPSRLAAFCKTRFGFAPKLLLRRQRFLRMLDALHRRPYDEWSDFVDPQYTDQSHMIRDFKYFMGMSPGQYLARPRQVQQASAIARSAAVGGALQGLD